jgi:hypothetical protein
MILSFYSIEAENILPQYVQNLQLKIYDFVKSPASKPRRILLEAISKQRFWFKIKAELSFNPQAYSSMSRT